MILGYIIYYLVFLFLFPYIIYRKYGLNAIRFYLPVIDVIALTLTSIEKEYLFDKLYETIPETWWGYFSTNFINTLALAGIVWQSVYFYSKSKDIFRTIMRSIIMIIMTYLIPLTLVPYVINKIRDADKTDDYREKIVLYLTGISLTILLLAMELFLIKFFIEFE